MEWNFEIQIISRILETAYNLPTCLYLDSNFRFTEILTHALSVYILPITGVQQSEVN